MKTDEETNEILKASKLDVAKKLASWYNIVPWCLVTIILLYIAFGRYKYNVASSSRSQSSTNNVEHVVNMLPEVKTPKANIATDEFKLRQLQKAAVSYGYGKWEVSDDGMTAFNWIEPKDWRDKRIIEKVTSTNMVVQIDLSKINGWFVEMDILARASRTLNMDLIKKIENYTNSSPQSRDFQMDEKDFPLRYSPKEEKFAESIGFNVEKELNTNISVEITNLINKWDGSNKSILIDSIKKVLIREIKNVFDGFNAYYKTK